MKSKAVDVLAVVTIGIVAVASISAQKRPREAPPNRSATVSRQPANRSPAPPRPTASQQFPFTLRVVAKTGDLNNGRRYKSFGSVALGDNGGISYVAFTIGADARDHVGIYQPDKVILDTFRNPDFSFDGELRMGSSGDAAFLGSLRRRGQSSPHAFGVFINERLIFDVMSRPELEHDRRSPSTLHFLPTGVATFVIGTTVYSVDSTGRATSDSLSSLGGKYALTVGPFSFSRSGEVVFFARYQLGNGPFKLREPISAGILSKQSVLYSIPDSRPSTPALNSRGQVAWLGLDSSTSGTPSSATTALFIDGRKVEGVWLHEIASTDGQLRFNDNGTALIMSSMHPTPFIVRDTERTYLLDHDMLSDRSLWTSLVGEPLPLSTPRFFCDLNNVDQVACSMTFSETDNPRSYVFVATPRPSISPSNLSAIPPRCRSRMQFPGDGLACPIGRRLVCVAEAPPLPASRPIPGVYQPDYNFGGITYAPEYPEQPTSTSKKWMRYNCNYDNGGVCSVVAPGGTAEDGYGVVSERVPSLPVPVPVRADPFVVDPRTSASQFHPSFLQAIRQNYQCVPGMRQ